MFAAPQNVNMVFCTYTIKGVSDLTNRDTNIAYLSLKMFFKSENK